MARFLGIILAVLLVVGALPASSVRAQVACAPATPGAVGSTSTFTLPQHTLASIRWSTYSAEIVFRVPLGVQATVYSGLGSYWVYDPASCTEAEVDRQARDHAGRIGVSVTNIYSLPSYLLQVTGIGYTPAPQPYTPPPSSYTPNPSPGQQRACPTFAGQATSPLWQPIYSGGFINNIIGYQQVGCRYYGGRAVAQVPQGFYTNYRFANSGDYRNGWQFYGSPGEVIQTDAADFFPS